MKSFIQTQLKMFGRIMLWDLKLKFAQAERDQPPSLSDGLPSLWCDSHLINCNNFLSLTDA